MQNRIGAAIVETAGFAEKYPGAAIFGREADDGSVLVAAWPDRLVVRMAGAIHSTKLIEALQDMRAAGFPASDAFSALIDLSTFTGEVDWQDIRQVKEIMPKGDSMTNKNAYIVRNRIFALTAKITSALFSQTEHVAFNTEKEALAWLGWDQPATKSGGP